MRVMADAKVFDRLKGGLYGVAIGDALGGTTEFMSVKEIEEKHGFLTEIIGGGVWRLAPGEVTDDTMMTLCVADGILLQPRQPLDSIGEKFLEWYGTRPKDVGNIIRYAFEHYEGNWFEAALYTDQMMGQSAGNGSLMRCLPAALAYPGLAEAEQIARLQSRMTHYDSRCGEACAIYTRIAYRLLQGEELREALRTEVTGTEYESALTDPPNCEPGGFVVHTMLWVVYLLATSTDFEQVVQRAANRGEDSDTIGAIAGGLAGIYCGYAGIPARYAEAIIIRERLDETASALMDIRQGSHDQVIQA
ncbi:ADP-ribosylglycohydrolase family protein [Paenibacillus agaridevorans]|uniref:ADP-ribosylglycohydrolase family protein n=1 Tax=Paenibacillus agaridevorans TaxID=171404 RepID=UPI003CCE9D74